MFQLERHKCVQIVRFVVCRPDFGHLSFLAKSEIGRWTTSFSSSADPILEKYYTIVPLPPDVGVSKLLQNMVVWLATHGFASITDGLGRILRMPWMLLAEIVAGTALWHKWNSQWMSVQSEVKCLLGFKCNHQYLISHLPNLYLRQNHFLN